MPVSLLVWLVQKVAPPIIIYMVVSSWSIAQGVDPTFANILGAAAGFGTIVISVKIGL